MIRRAVVSFLFTGLAISLVGCRADPTPAPPSVLLVILDTVRADHFSSYGYEKMTTFNFDRLAGEGERYAEAYAQAPWTLPAVASILTGQPPRAHGAGRGQGGVSGLHPEVTTLAERFSAQGYRTAAFINVVWCSPGLSALDRGFELYDFHDSDETNRNQRNAEETTDAALAWLDGVGSDPFFAVVHYFDPHLTYDPPAPYDSKFEPYCGPRIPPNFGSAAEVVRVRGGEIELDERLRRSLVARYDGELAFVDDQFGRLRRVMKQAGRWDDTLVVVVGDHGEEFWDHGGFEHGHTHHRELLRVPLIVRKPDGPVGVVRDGRARQIDIAPTILDFAGLPVPDELPGRVLDERGAAYSVAEGSLWAGDLVSIRGDRGTLILDRTSGERRFFAPDDPLEQRVANDDPAGADLEQLLTALPPLRTRDEPLRPLTEQELERVRSLGYIE